MDIKIENNKIQVADISAFTNRTIYSVSQSKDSVTFIFNDSIRKSVIVKDTTVNGTVMTTNNIDELLSPLFVDTTSGSGTETQTKTYTKAQYSEPLVFPMPEQTGHIVEFYKDSILYQTYQWNGWNWVIMGAEPNLIFTPNDGYTQNILESQDTIFSRKERTTNYLSLKKDGDFGSTKLVAKNIELITKDYTLGEITIYQNETFSSLKVPSFKTNSLIINRYDKDYNYISESIELTDSEAAKVNINLTAERCLLKNIVSPIADSTEYRGYMSIKSADLTLDNAGCSNMTINGLQEDKSSIAKNSYTIINNFLLSQNGSNIRVAGNEDSQTIIVADLNISNNIGLSMLTLASFNSGASINSFVGTFDKYIRSISVTNCVFEQEALDSFVQALADAPANDSISRSFEFRNSTPSLTEDQKTKLTNIGWKIS